MSSSILLVTNCHYCFCVFTQSQSCWLWGNILERIRGWLEMFNKTLEEQFVWINGMYLRCGCNAVAVALGFAKVAEKLPSKPLFVELLWECFPLICRPDHSCFSITWSSLKSRLVCCCLWCVQSNNTIPKIIGSIRLLPSKILQKSVYLKF